MDTSQRKGSAAEPAIMDRLGRLKAMLRTDPHNPRLTRDCIELAIQAGDYDFVLEQTQALLAVSPEDSQARFDRATALIGKRDFRSASEVLQTLVAPDFPSNAVHRNLGLCYYCLADYAQAHAHLKPLYENGDRAAGLLRLLVSTCHHLGLMEEAVDIADQNPEPASADPALAGVYALVYLDDDQAPKAAKWSARALASNPDSVDGLIVQGTLRAAQMDAQRAKEQFEHVLQIAPNTGRAWVGLGTLSLLERDLEGARTQIQRGLDLMPGHVGSWHVLGWTHIFAGDLDAAEKIFQHAFDLDRNFAETHGGLASVAALRGNASAAEQHIERALRLDDACLSVRFAQSILARRAGDSAHANRLVRDTVAGLSPKDGSVLSRILETASGKVS